MNSAPKPV